MNKFIETRNNERYMRFEHIAGASGKFWEICVPTRFDIWLCQGEIGSEGTNSHLSWRDWGSMDEGVNLQWASKLVDEKQKTGFVYAGEVKKIIDAKYRGALTSLNPQELLDCIQEGYSPFAVVDVKSHAGSAMEIAIAGGVLESVRALVNAGCSIDNLPKWKDVNFDFSRSPLLFALEYTKSAKMVKFILELGADVNKTSGSESKAPLHAAGSVELVKIILKHGANVDTVDRFGRSALQRLLDYSSNSYFEMIKVLIKYKAEVNNRDMVGDTPIITAARNGNHEAVELLLGTGADLSACNDEGANALVEAVWRHDESHTKTIRILLKAGADANSRMKGKVTALMVAADRDAGGNIKLLIEAGADIDAIDDERKTALLRVAGLKGTAVKSLIKSGAALDLQDKTGKTAAMYAATNFERREKWKSTGLKSLIGAGANLAIEDSSGRGPLQTDCIEAAMILLDSGALPNKIDSESLMSLAIADDNLTLALKVLEKSDCNIKFGNAKSKKNLPVMLRKIAAANLPLLSRLSSQEMGIKALLDAELAHSSRVVVSEYVPTDELPDILKSGVWSGTETGKAVSALPSFWNALIHPSPRLLSSPKPLPPAAIDTIAQMVLASTHDAPIPEIAQVQTACDRQSLAKFAWSIFHEWTGKGNKATDGFFQVLGYWGDDDCAKALTPLIRNWPKVQQSQRAAMGLEILGTMGTDVALAQIQAIAAKTKYDSLRLRADALMKKVATTRKLSAEQLEDRLVPSLDLSDDGALRLDFGSRYFIASVNEQLQPILKDANGIAIKALPKASSTDDARLAAQSSEKWLEFKKDLKPVSGLQLSRLEQAMSNSRRWVGEDFNNLLVNHSLLQKAVRGLVWAVYHKKKQVSTFAFRPDGTAIDVNGIAVVVKSDARVGVPHPLDMAAELPAWKEAFRQSKQAQPFPQLVRKIYSKESGLDNTLFGLQGLVVPSMAFKGLKALGWNRDSDTFAGTFDSFSRRFASGSASITVSPGLSLAAYDALGSEQTLSVSSAGLAPVDFSELVRELQTLKG
jgi:ankyrin repeat protein